MGDGGALQGNLVHVLLCSSLALADCLRHFARLADAITDGALAVAHDNQSGKGTIGYGIGKSGEVPEAIRKGEAAAKKNMHKVALKGTTIPHEIVGKYGAGAVLLKPAAPGTGMIAGGPVRAVIEAAGIKDIRAKSMRSNNPINVVSATFAGLCGLVSAESVAEKRGKTVKEILG